MKFIPQFASQRIAQLAALLATVAPLPVGEVKRRGSTRTLNRRMRRRKAAFRRSLHNLTPGWPRLMRATGPGSLAAEPFRKWYVEKARRRIGGVVA